MSVPVNVERGHEIAVDEIVALVEDARAGRVLPVAARAAELGGRVVVPPFDAPWVRIAVIADPQGATYTASKFVPENKDVAAPAA